MNTNTLGPVRCQHRWTAGPTLPYPRTPGLTADDDMGEFVIETASCKRCGGARLRLRSTEREHVRSSWSYAETMAEVLLGRPLEEHEERRVRDVVLN